MTMRWLEISRNNRSAFLLVIHAPDRGESIPPHAIVGQVDPGPDGSPDWPTFRHNTVFLEHFGRFMRGELAKRPRILDRARVAPGEHLYVIDPRVGSGEGEVPFHEIVGWYRTDAAGAPVGSTFERNADHRLVREDGVVSAVLHEDALAQSM